MPQLHVLKLWVIGVTPVIFVSCIFPTTILKMYLVSPRIPCEDKNFTFSSFNFLHSTYSECLFTQHSWWMISSSTGIMKSHWYLEAIWPTLITGFLAFFYQILIVNLAWLLNDKISFNKSINDTVFSMKRTHIYCCNEDYSYEAC